MGDVWDGSEPVPEAEPLRQKRREEFELEVAGAPVAEPERCGIGCCSPNWIQRMATRQAFMMVFSILAIVQGMSWSYFTATITTLEKRFKISSQTAGNDERAEILYRIWWISAKIWAVDFS